MSNTNLFASTEIIGALTTNNLSAEDAKTFAADPQAAIAAMGVDVSHIDVKVAQNSENDVSIVLPYYTQVEVFQSEMLKDEKLNNVAGGEIIISLAIIGGVAIGSTVAVSAGIAGTGVVVAAAIGGAIGGTIAGGIVTAAVVAGAVEGKKKAASK